MTIMVVYALSVYLFELSSIFEDYFKFFKMESAFYKYFMFEAY